MAPSGKESCEEFSSADVDWRLMCPDFCKEDIMKKVVVAEILIMLAILSATTCWADFAYTFQVEHKPFSLAVTAKKTVINYSGKTYINPDPTRFIWFGKTYCKYLKDSGILYVGKGNDELMVSVLRVSTPKLKGVIKRRGKPEIIRQPGNTDTTYRYACWFKSRDGKRIYEVVEEVESKKIPLFFENAVLSFKEVK
jgi:hypothetical protein